jgi:uncharacterized membrane protein YbhN (UPF0104 family)
MNDILNELKNITRKKFFRVLWPPIRILLSVGLLLKAVSGIDWAVFSGERINMNPWWMLLGIASLLCANLFAGIRWAFLMKNSGFGGPVLGFINLVFAGNLINQGLPSTLGGDSYRAIAGAHLKPKGGISGLKKMQDEIQGASNNIQASPKIRVSFLTTFIDRLLGLGGNNILGGVGLIIGGAAIAGWCVNLGYAALLLMGVIGLIAAIGVQQTQSVSFIKKTLSYFQLSDAFSGIKFAFGFPLTIVQLGVSTGIHILNIVALGCCFRIFNVIVPWEALMIGLPALSLLLVLPISISGWGLREATLSSILLLWGIDQSVTVLASLSYGALIVICAMPGAYILLKPK